LTKTNPKTKQTKKRKKPRKGKPQKGYGIGDLESVMEGFGLEAKMGLKELGHRREVMGL
jgi:hypothetical protein